MVSSPEPTTSVVIVDRISVLGIKPDYCIHGESLCSSCGKGVWLGSETVKAVLAGAQPLCLVCATAMAEMNLLPAEGPVDHIHDHRRADGPHE